MTAIISRVAHTGKLPKTQSHAPIRDMTVMASSLAVVEITPWSCQSRTGGPKTR